jgi:hypothetical protein
MSFTPTFNNNLDGSSIHPSQLLYDKTGADCRAWIVLDIFRKGLFSDWAVRIVPEDNTGTVTVVWLNEMTDRPITRPPLHPQHRGFEILTRNGRRLKVISRSMA